MIAQLPLGKGKISTSRRSALDCMMEYTTFWNCLIAAAGLFVALGENPTHGREKGSFATVQPGVRQLFLGDALIEQREGFTRVVNPVTKHPGNPLIVPEKPWEAGMLMVHNSVAYDALAGCFKMWCLIPGFATQAGRRTAYFTSADGLTWERPELGLVDYSGSVKNNLIPVNLSHVVYDPAEQGRDATGQRFKGIGWGSPPGQHAAFSEDGLHTINQTLYVAIGPAISEARSQGMKNTE